MRFHYEFDNGFIGDFAFVVTNYVDSGNIAIRLDVWNEEYNGYEPYAMVTVNLNGTTCLDTNNFPEGEKLMKDKDLGYFTGKYKHSGFVDYPVYVFNLDNLSKYFYTE